MDTKHSSQEEDTSAANPSPYPGTPRWVKVLGIIILILIILAVIALATGLGGPHGPGRHLPSSGSGIEPILLSLPIQVIALIITNCPLLLR